MPSASGGVSRVVLQGGIKHRSGSEKGRDCVGFNLEIRKEKIKGKGSREGQSTRLTGIRIVNLKRHY